MLTPGSGTDTGTQRKGSVLGVEEVNGDAGEVELERVAFSCSAPEPRQCVCLHHLTTHSDLKTEVQTTRLIQARARASGAGKKLRGVHISSHLGAPGGCRRTALLVVISYFHVTEEGADVQGEMTV